VTAPSLPGTSSDPSRPTSGGTSSDTTSVPVVTPVTEALPSVSDVTDTGTKAGDVVGQTVTGVTGVLGGG
jgi:hypothetical protein